ncbi:TauD/TfdA family dioxygenase [Salinicola rhizosphaerae]|uniref:Gamma-butyrobetaine hydroxylase n=1 Tax=Salinicola rhizosphaerae TaxID=1443141 RepID=A0ABQ3DWP6_9GAMM|nr:TauD/TfdA family dioxygenase [Salinicola rhizosphaerae]GHB16251.1 gamma-butyrobetaine hydroxylase [Salinicola rhizosphaerae]
MTSSADTSITTFQPSDAAAALPPTPDFDVWPIEVEIASLSHSPDILTITWRDGRVSRYHAVWLRENAADDSTINPATRERILDLSTLPDWPTLSDSRLEANGAVTLTFAPENRTLAFHPGWLRANDYDNRSNAEAPMVPTLSWLGAERDGPATLDAARWMDQPLEAHSDDPLLRQALEALIGEGLVRLRHLPTEPGSLEAIARRIGPPRPTNFGYLFDVRAKPDPDSNAYTSIALPPHVDLPTREYQPGLQLLHCLENDTVGGEAVMMDGFAVAQALRERHPEHFETLTRVRWCYANTAKTTDYVWFDPMIKLDANGEFDEVRIADFLRGPLMAPFDDVEPAYAALLALQRLLREPAFALRFTYAPGDLVIFDNRRLLHARDAFDVSQGGSRWLQGCYLERDEARSRLRMLKRAERRARRDASGDSPR